MSEPALYCGTYGKYNDGSIAGKWLKVSDYANAEEFLQACRELHKDEPDPEFMFQDFENMPRAFYSESLGREDIEKIYGWINLDESDRQLVGEYADATGYSFEDFDLDDVHESYECNLNDVREEYEDGFFSNEKAYGYHMQDVGVVEIPEHLQCYVDYEAIGRDYLMDCSVSSDGYVFRSN